MHLDTLSLTIEDNVGHITMLRPEKGNPIGQPFCEDFAKVVEECHWNPGVRAILLSSAPGKVFSVGGDVAAFAGAGDGMARGMERMINTLHPTIDMLMNTDAPVVTAVNGAAAGAAFSLVLGSGIVFATERSAFTTAYTKIGLSPDGSSTFFLPRIVGMRRATELFLTARMVPAQEALELGIINDIVSENDLMPKAMDMARMLAKGPTKSFGSVGRLLNASYSNDLTTQLVIEGQAMVEATKTSDGLEGVSSFVAKKTPEFQGK